MKKIPILLLINLLMWLSSCEQKKTDLILLGTVHQPVENFNSDSLYNILVKLKPDLILFEVDSSFFTPEFEFNKTWDSNENIATVKYMTNYEVDVRPYEFTGRNEYRIKIGSRPTDSKALSLLDSLYQNNQLDATSNEVYQSFLRINDSLNTFAYLGAQAFNSIETDKIASKRQEFQYEKLLNIMEKYPVFSNTYHLKSVDDSISYFDGFNRASEFWDLRNQTMAKNILQFTKEYSGQRIVVLNGYFHRFYLKSLLGPAQEENHFVIRDFYEF